MSIFSYMAIVIPLLIINGMIIYHMFNYEPIKRGDVAEFWEYACGVELATFTGHARYSRYGGIYPGIGNTHFYYFQEHHGRHVFQLTEQQVVQVSNELKDKLSKEIVNTKDSPRHGDKEKLLRIKNSKRIECATLFSKFNDVTLVVNNLSQPRSDIRSFGGKYWEKEVESFRERWRRVKRIKFSYLFEGVFLSSWVTFVMWPVVRKGSRSRYALHFGLSPLLLFLPHYMGYAPFTFTYGPSGGLVYPRFILLGSVPFLWVGVNELDILLLRNIPQLLEPLSMLSGPAMAMSYRGFVGPTTLLGFGLVVATITFWLRGKAA